VAPTDPPGTLRTLADPDANAPHPTRTTPAPGHSGGLG